MGCSSPTGTSTPPLYPRGYLKNSAAAVMLATTGYGQVKMICPPAASS